MLLGCRTPAWGALFLVLCLTVAAPSIAQEAPDAWTDIRADYRDGRFQSAIARLERLVAANPNDREAYYYLGLINWRLGNMPAAASAYKRVIELDPAGPFGQDARLWLQNYANLTAQVTPAPRPTTAVAPVPTPVALPSPPRFLATPAPRPSTGKPRAMPSRTPWLQIEPKETTNRPRGMNARKGYFKVADGTFEFIPPKGFVLLSEGIDGSEWHALFGPAYNASMAAATEQPPTLLIVWRELPELKRFRPDQRAARERQLLTIEAATYGPGAKLEAAFGVPCYRVDQHHGDWSAVTRLFFKHDRLYALTYGGDASLLPKFQPQVDQSWVTPIFYP
ncbi:MAG: Tetratricopeptide repeat [Cyanobacteria bacterium RYN_339]|nr:Tetratricopeptide repeat [Cyanobacteria bacterium RYN_339]